MTGASLPSAVIFDWDNTLVDSWPAIAESINYARAKYGLETWDMDGIIARCTRSARESFPDWFGDRWPQAIEDYYAYFQDARARIGLHPVNGAADLLAWLGEQGIPSVVVSNKKGGYLRQECEMLSWHSYFKSLVGAGDASHDKPARQHADHALGLAGLKAHSDIWFVGDSEADVTCARNAGCTPVLIGNKQAALNFNVEIFATDCRQLLDLLKDRRRVAV